MVGSSSRSELGVRQDSSSWQTSVSSSATARLYPLMSKAFDTLVFLVANRHRVVTKDELFHTVWPDVTVEEGNLTQQIFLLRKALGDNAQTPRYHRHRSRGTVIASRHE